MYVYSPNNQGITVQLTNPNVFRTHLQPPFQLIIRFVVVLCNGLLDSEILSHRTLNALDLVLNGKNPMIAFCAASGTKDDTTALAA